MTTFDLEMEILPVWPNAREIVKTSDALAQSAADLMEEIVPERAAEYVPEAMTAGAADLLGEAVAGDTAESEGQDIPAYGTEPIVDGVQIGRASCRERV